MSFTLTSSYEGCRGNEGCRPGRVRVTFESNRQVWLKNLGDM